ncbi:uncharacterized protein VTP21DRAFT_9738 [Calcarisporiella thermophila]|uniref:uncharacterized protein n=1 Tax=Calcarisporiella thermophila TaxID=911321 RepID=UPI00374388E9
MSRGAVILYNFSQLFYYQFPRQQRMLLLVAALSSTFTTYVVVSSCIRWAVERLRQIRTIRDIIQAHPRSYTLVSMGPQKQGRDLSKGTMLPIVFHHTILRKKA